MTRSGGGPARVVVWLVMLLVAAGALLVAAVDDPGPRTADDRARALAATIRCPTCRGQSVLESDAATARAIRTEISRRIGEGETDDEIRAYLVSVHGRSVLLNPPRSGLAGLVWVLPIVGLGVAGAGLVLAFRRWQTPAPSATDADAELVRDALAASSRRAPEEQP